MTEPTPSERLDEDAVDQVAADQGPTAGHAVNEERAVNEEPDAEDTPTAADTPDLGSPTDSPAAEGNDHAVTDTVRELLAEVDEIRQAAGDTFDLAALARQTKLLEHAHDALSEALGSVDHRGA